MAGFLPILVASTGATPQAASDAPNQPTGADGVFAAVLSEVSGTAPAHGHGLPVADGPFALPQMAMPPAGSALQRLKLAFASPDALPAGLALATGTASSMFSLTTAPAIAPVSVPEADAPAEQPANTGDAAVATPVGAAAAESKQSQTAAPALAAMTVEEAARTVASPTLQPQPETDTEDHGETQQTVDNGHIPVRADQPVPLNREQAPSEGEASLLPGQERPAHDAPVQRAASPQAAQPTDQPAPQPAVATAGQPASPAVDGPAIAASEPQIAGARAPVSTTANSNPHPTDAPGVPEAKAQPDGMIEERDLPTARHDLTGKGAATSLADRAVLQSAMPTQTSAQPNAAAAANPTPAEVAALAAMAPASGMAAPAQRAPSARNATASASMTDASANGAAVTGSAPAQTENTEGDAAAPVSSALKTAAEPMPSGRAPEQAGPAPAASGKFALAENSPAPADQPVVDTVAADEHTQPARRTADEAQAAQPKAGNTQPAQADRPAVMTAEAPASQTNTAQATTPEALQPLSAQPVSSHVQSGAMAAQPQVTEHVRVATPQQVPEAVGLAISRQVSAEATEFTLRLDPAELGRVEVKLDIGKDGQTIVSIQADNASTFDLLRRDSQALERALAEAGLKLDSGGLNFSLRQQDGQGQQQFAGEANGRPFRGQAQDTALAGSEPDNTPRPSRRSAAGLLDLSI